jgi:malonyl-CoA decarboxylase
VKSQNTTTDEQAVGQALALCEALLSERGEVSGARLAAQMLAAYQALDATARDVFLGRLAAAFNPNQDDLIRGARRYATDPSVETLARLRTAIESPRQELFRRTNQAQGGTAALIDMRRQLLATLGAHPERAGVDADLAGLFRAWFNRGFLNLQRIDWHTPAVILERLIQYEAVHEIKGWGDLHRRLEGDRRCYAFFHPALPDEPLIFIEVALTRGLPPNVQTLLDPDSPISDASKATSAIFYSITNCQDGLRGISFGNFLIKQVVEDLGREFPRLELFATLSPVPGFRQWLRSAGPELSYSQALDTLLGAVTRVPGAGAATGPRRRASDQMSATRPLASVSPELRAEITTLCADYLVRAKRHGAPLDPVARFHLANGARLERLNWMADSSPAGLSRSLGIMVNYVYRADELERNHEAYARHGIVVASPRVTRTLARKIPRRRASA